VNVVKQYGLERSGTNYIKALIELNCPNTFVAASAFGPKHNMYEPVDLDSYDPRYDKKIRIDELTDDEVCAIKSRFRDNQVYYLISIKNPYSWIVSFRKYMARHELECPYIQELVNKWNEYNKNWHDLILSKPGRGAFVEYFTLIKNPEIMVKRIASKFNIPLNPVFHDIKNNMGEGTDRKSVNHITPEPFNKIDYYKNQEYMKDLSSDEIYFISKKADFSLFSACQTFL